MIEQRIDNAYNAPIAGDLPTDGAGSDDVSVALKARTKVHKERDALEWLMEGDSAAQPTGDGEPIQPRVDIDDDELPSVEVPDDRPLWRRAAGDIMSGAFEAPKQIYGGIVDAVGEVADLAQTIAPAGGVQLFDDQGNFDPSMLSADEFDKGRAEGKDVISQATSEDPDTMTGSVVRATAQFLAPFSAINKGMKGAGLLASGTKTATAGRGAIAGAGADFAAFDGLEDRLSNLVQTVPALQNPVTEYLAADGDDTEIEGRVKNALEGLGIGVGAEAVFKGIKAYRNWKKAPDPIKDQLRAGKAIEDMPEDSIFREADDLDQLGNNDADLIVNQIEDAPSTGVPDDVVAKSLTDKGLTELGEGSGTYVNWSKIETPDDIKRIIDDTATAFKEPIDEARRGVRTNVETQISADKLDAWDILKERRAGDPLNAEQTLAARQLWATSADKLAEVAEVAAKNPTNENLFQFRRMMATFHGIQKEVIAARTETARALQQWAIPAGGKREMMRDLTQALDMSGGRQTAITMAELVHQMAKSENATGLSQFADKALYARSRDSLQEYWINALLSGPKTHLVNAISNTAVMGMSIVERSAAAQVGKLTGTEGGVEAGEALAQINGLTNGINDAFRNAAKAFKTGQTGYGVNKVETPRTRSLSSTNWNIRSESWLGKGVDTLGAVVNTPGRMLQTADEFFKTLNYRMELHSQAFRQAKQAVDSGQIELEDMKSFMADVIADPPEAIRMDAAENAAYQTFTDTPGEFTKGINTLRHRFPLMNFIIPFVNTPSNILAYTFERTPLAPVTKKYKQAIAEGGAKADMARARMALGSMAIMASVDMGMRGSITGSGPENRTEKANWRRQGFQPYSVKIGDKWIAYNRLDPLGFLMGIGGDVAEFSANADFGENTAEEMQEAMAAVVFSVVENITSKSYLQGISMLADAINQPERSGSYYIERLASSFIPSGVGEAARFNDPIMRASHDIISSMKRKLPGYTDDLPPRRDMWGRELKYESGLGKVYDTMSPLYASQFKPQPVDEAMRRDGWFIGNPSKVLSVDGERISMKNNPEIYSEYMRLQGNAKPSEMDAEGLLDRYGDRNLLEVLNDVVSSDDTDDGIRYAEAEDPDEKREVISRITRRYRRAARKIILRDYPVLQDMATQKKQSRTN